MIIDERTYQALIISENECGLCKDLLDHAVINGYELYGIDDLYLIENDYVDHLLQIIRES